MADMKKYLSTEGLSALVDQIKAEDAKILAAAKSHAEGLGVNYDAAGTAATKVKELADGAVATNATGVAENKAAIAKLNGDVNTEGSVVKAVSDAKALIDADIDAVEAVANKNKEDIAAINNAESGILAQAKSFATTEDAKVQGNVDTLAGTVADLDAFVGEIPEGYTQETVIAYINKKAEETLAAAQGGSSETAASVKAQLDTYKSDNDARVLAVEGDIADLEAAIASEQERAEGIESGLDTRIKALEDDHLTSADRTALEQSIQTNANAIERLTNGVSADEVDGVNDLIQYVKDHGTEVTGMQGDIADNAAAIEGVAGRMTTAEGKITAVEGAVATKAEKTYVDEQVQTLQGVDATQNEKIAALEAKFAGGDGSVEDMITDAKTETLTQAAEDAASKDAALETALKKYADEEDAKIEATVATLTETVNGKAAQSEVTTISGDVATLKTDMAQAKTDIDNVEAKAAANETAITGLQTAVNGKVAQGDFDNAVARIAQNESDISALEEASATHALASDLTAAVERIAANETAIANNTSAINSFAVISADEVNALFA